VALHKLPVQLRMLVRVMGEAAAYRLVQAWGGTPFTVPKSVRARQFARLADVVGVDAATALVAELPGETLQLPKYDGVLRQLRHQRVIDLRRQRLRLAEIALATAYSVRQVINILNASGLPLHEPGLGLDGTGLALQGDLFGGASTLADDDDVAPADAAQPMPVRGRAAVMRARPAAVS